MVLRSDLAIERPDEFYNRLIDCVQSVGEDKAALFNARLILLLANQVGDAKVLHDCIDAARQLPA